MTFVHVTADLAVDSYMNLRDVLFIRAIKSRSLEAYYNFTYSAKNTWQLRDKTLLLYILQ